MLAPSGGGLILYQAYGNLYAMTGREAHLVKDKQIPSVGVSDEVFLALGGNTHDLGSFGEETDKITDLHQILEEILLTERGDGVAGIKYFAWGVAKLLVEVPYDNRITLLVPNINHLAFRSMMEREKLSANNFNDWFRQLNLVLRVEKKMFVYEQPLPAAPTVDSEEQVLAH
ncbi:hypothetical protein Tco_0811660 [Tanacetum coccineum]